MSWDIFLVETQSAVRSRHNKKENSPKGASEGRVAVDLAYRPPVPPHIFEKSYKWFKRHAYFKLLDIFSFIFDLSCSVNGRESAVSKPQILVDSSRPRC